MTDFVWKVNSLIRNNNDIVTTVRLNMVGTETVGVGESSITYTDVYNYDHTLKAPSSNPIGFSSLTEATVVDWVEYQIEEHDLDQIQKDLQSRIDNKKINKIGTPW